MTVLRPYQLEALKLCKERYEAGIRRQLIAMPTGTGKTVVFAHAKKQLGLNGRVLVVVHRRELVDQACRAFRKLGYKPGRELGDESSYSGDEVVVASVQSLGRAGTERLRKFNPEDFGLLICDEAHHSVANTYQHVYEHFGVLGGSSNALLIGVTATPVRSDGKSLGDVFQEIVYHMDIREAVIDGWLVDIKGVRARTESNLDNVRVLPSGDFDQVGLSRTINNQVRNALVLKTWRERAEGRQTIVFCADIQHSKDMAETFQSAGVKAEAIWGDDRDRSEKLRKHKAREFSVLTNCEVLTEGYDDWSVSCIVMARPTQSELLFVQMAGRGTRIPGDIKNLNVAKAEGLAIAKSDCLIVDVVDNTAKHSLITLPTLFGYASSFDYNGRSAISDHPKDHSLLLGRASHPAVIAGVKPLIREVDLLGLGWVDPLFAGSVLQWFTTSTGEQILPLPKGDSFRIYWARGGWEVKADLRFQKFTSGPFSSLEKAFSDVEDSLGRYCTGLLRKLSNETTLPRAKPTPLQFELMESAALTKDRVYFRGLSRAKAQALLAEVLGHKYKATLKPTSTRAPSVRPKTPARPTPPGRLCLAKMPSGCEMSFILELGGGLASRF